MMGNPLHDFQQPAPLRLPAVHGHGASALCSLLSDLVYKLQDAFRSVGCGHPVIGPRGVVKMGHILHLVSLWEKNKR